MKHFRPFTAVLAALMITSAVIFSACSKQVNDLQSIDSGETHMTAADLKFQKQLVEFRDKVKYIQKHPGYKSGEMMSVDSAIYLMYYAAAEITPLVDSVKCLAHQEMNFYVEGGIEIATNKLPDTYNKPSNWLFMSCDYYDVTEGSLEDEVLRHKADFVFSLRYLIPEEEDPRIIL